MASRSGIRSAGLALATVALAGARAQAQSVAPEAMPPIVVAQPVAVQPVVVDVAPDVTAVSPEALRASLSRDLGVPAVTPDDPAAGSARGTLRVVVDAERHLVLTFRNAAGREVWRMVSDASDSAAALATVAFLAGSFSHEGAATSAPPASSTEATLPVQTIVGQPTPVTAPPAAPSAQPPAPPPTLGAPPPGMTWALVTLRPERYRPGPEERAFNRRARHDPALGFYAFGGGGVSGFGETAVGVTGVNLAVTPRLLVDLSFGSAKPESGFPNTWVPHTVENRTWVGAMLALRLPFHVFRFEAGAGPVVIWGDTFVSHVDDTNLRTINDLSTPANYVRFGVQGRASVYAAIHRYVDFFVTLYGAYSDGVYGNAAGRSYDSRWFLAGGAGLQIRVPTAPRRRYVPGA